MKSTGFFRRGGLVPARSPLAATAGTVSDWHWHVRAGTATVTAIKPGRIGPRSSCRGSASSCPESQSSHVTVTMPVPQASVTDYGDTATIMMTVPGTGQPEAVLQVKISAGDLGSPGSHVHGSTTCTEWSRSTTSIIMVTVTRTRTGPGLTAAGVGRGP